MVRIVLTFALAFMLSVTAGSGIVWAKNWNLNKNSSSPTENSLEYQHEWLPYAGDPKVKIYGGHSIPEKATPPNLETLKYYYYRYLKIGRAHV